MEFAKRIELEITLRCNNYCPTCNRHCNVYDRFADSDMTEEQLERFVRQVEDKGDVWDSVAIMGGEPTLHPLLKETTEKIWSRLVKTGLVKNLQIWTNGKIPVDIGDIPITELETHEEIVLNGTVHLVIADHDKKIHYQALMAPIDTGQVRIRCPKLAICGIALNAYGYWPCGPAGAMARLFAAPAGAKQDLPGGGD